MEGLECQQESDKKTQNVTFVDANDDDITELIEGSKTKNTNRSTKLSTTRFREYLKHAKLPDLEEIDIAELPKVLTNFYISVRTKKTGELYQTSKFCVQATTGGLNRTNK